MFAAFPLHDPDGDPIMVYVNQVVAFGRADVDDVRGKALVHTVDGRSLVVQESFERIYQIATGREYDPDTFQPTFQTLEGLKVSVIEMTPDDADRMIGDLEDANSLSEELEFGLLCSDRIILNIKRPIEPIPDGATDSREPE